MNTTSQERKKKVLYIHIHIHTYTHTNTRIDVWSFNMAALGTFSWAQRTGCVLAWPILNPLYKNPLPAMIGPSSEEHRVPGVKLNEHFPRRRLVVCITMATLARPQTGNIKQSAVHQGPQMGGVGARPAGTAFCSLRNLPDLHPGSKGEAGWGTCG